MRQHLLPSLSRKNSLAQSAETTSKINVPTRSCQSDQKTFEQPVLLRQSPIWSRAILWVLMGATSTVVVWASVAKIEEAIPAAGKLEPQNAVKEVQAPVGGVVTNIHVKDGQRVQQGDRLLSIDSTAAQAQLASLVRIRTSLIKENQFYRTQMGSGPRLSRALDPVIGQLKLPVELISLTKSRATLAAENQLYRAQLGGSVAKSRLSPEQLQRLQSQTDEFNTRVAAAKLEVAQIKSQLSQTQIQLASARETLKMHQEILQDLEPLTKKGALSRLQYLKEQQEVRSSRSEVDQLTQEQLRQKLQIATAQSKLQNIIALERKDLLTKMADNDKSIAEIDSQLTKAMVENNKRIAEIDSQLSQTAMTLKYQDLRAPSSGTVFDLQANSPGFVANSSEPILKVVPDDALTAKVFITNRDIGFVREGMKVDLRIDSFPFSEFGDVKGELVWIGSDALPPDQNRSFYSFPAKVRLERQSLLVNSREVPLQSGMSVNANIKLRSRTVASIFTDMFSKNIESLKFVR